MTINITLTDNDLVNKATWAKLISALIDLAPAEIQKAAEEAKTTTKEVKAPVEQEYDLPETEETAEPETETEEILPEEKAAPKISESEVRGILGKLQRADGGKTKVRAILNGLGAKNFPDLSPDKYTEAFEAAKTELKKLEEE